MVLSVPALDVGHQTRANAFGHAGRPDAFGPGNLHRTRRRNSSDVAAQAVQLASGHEELGRDAGLTAGLAQLVADMRDDLRLECHGAFAEFELQIHLDHFVKVEVLASRDENPPVREIARVLARKVLAIVEAYGQ